MRSRNIARKMKNFSVRSEGVSSPARVVCGELSGGCNTSQSKLAGICLTNQSFLIICTIWSLLI